MFVLPLFLMKDAARLTGLTSLVLHDKLPDRPPDKVQCNSCTAWTSTYDLSAMLATAASCIPQLAAMDFVTHYISDAECAAIARMTGLTRLVLGSTHGFKLGGLRRMSCLGNLAHLGLLSNSPRCDAGDVVMVLNCSKLTHLTLGYYQTMTPPLLATLADMVQAAAEAEGQHSAQAPDICGSQQQQQDAACAVLSSRTADGALQYPPPPLRELHLVLSPYMASYAGCLRHTCCLTQLVQLSVGWLVAAEDHLSANRLPPLQAQAGLSQLLHLTHLALGWPASYDSLSLLAPLAGLQSLQVGGLPSLWPPEPPPHTLRLPSISHLTVHVPVPVNVLVMPPSWLAGLQLEDMLPHPVQVPQPAAGVEQGPRQEHHQGLTSSGDGGQQPGPEQHHGLWVMWEDGQGDMEFARLEPAGTRLPPSLAALTPPIHCRSRLTASSSQAADKVTDPRATGSASASASARLSPSVCCDACGAPPCVRCLCQLQALEVVGPLCGEEVGHLRRLTALTRLILRDNSAWSTGLPLDNLVQAIVGLRRLKRVDIYDCPGVDAAELERCIVKHNQQHGQQWQQWESADVGSSAWRSSLPAVNVIHERSSPAELGLGHQYFGCFIDQAQLLGMVEGQELEADGGVVHPQLPPANHMWHYHMANFAAFLV
eukprot:gene5265-5500_t